MKVQQSGNESFYIYLIPAILFSLVTTIVAKRMSTPHRDQNIVNFFLISKNNSKIPLQHYFFQKVNLEFKAKLQLPA
jgi:hypothetical protein